MDGADVAKIVVVVFVVTVVVCGSKRKGGRVRSELRRVAKRRRPAIVFFGVYSSA